MRKRVVFVNVLLAMALLAGCESSGDTGTASGKLKQFYKSVTRYFIYLT